MDRETQARDMNLTDLITQEADALIDHYSHVKKIGHNGNALDAKGGASAAGVKALRDVLLPLVEAHDRQAKAETLREAADGLDLPGSDATGYYASEQHAGYRMAEIDVDKWLHDRANRIEGTLPTQGGTP